MSWVYLTGEYAYKIKKPVKFDFVDFSDLASRKRFCDIELARNRAFAPHLYLDVVPVIRNVAGNLQITEAAEDGEVVNWAVRMKQFDPDQQADALISANQLSTDMMRDFGQRLALLHERLPPVQDAAQIADVIEENFDTLSRTAYGQTSSALLEQLRRDARADLQNHADLLRRRAEGGYVRPCHGDLHLGNIVSLQGELWPFDCLEFSERLSTTDVWADVAFLVMDTSVQEKESLAHAFIDGYLGETGDYAGAVLLGLFSRYRAMVRAKVAALRFEQTSADEDWAHSDRYCQWALERGQTSPQLIITHGLSGSGKSFWARQLVEQLHAIRIRSDVLRKTQHGLTPLDQSDSEPGGGLYTSATSADLYEAMAAIAVDLLKEGQNVIVDAACLQKQQRETLTGAGTLAGARCCLLSFTAPRDVLERRIVERSRDGTDPSEADLKVLDWQVENAEPVAPEEDAFVVDTTELTMKQLLSLIRNRG